MALFHTTVLDNQIKALPTVDTASGSIATFDTDMTENLVSLVAEISASASKCYIANMSDITLKQLFEGLMLGTYAFVDLGTVSWTRKTDGAIPYFRHDFTDSSLTQLNRAFACSDYPNVPFSNIYTNGQDKASASYSGGIFIISDNDYSDATAFTNAMSGVYLIYELATPTTPTITKSQFETLLNAFNLSGWLFEYDFGETVTSGASLDCISGTLTRSDDSTKSIGGNIITALSDNNIFASTGNVAVKYVLSVEKAIS